MLTSIYCIAINYINTFTPQITGATQATAQLARLHTFVSGLQLGSDYIDIDAKIDCGDRYTHVISMHDLDFVLKTTQMESILLSSPSYELKNVGLR